MGESIEQTALRVGTAFRAVIDSAVPPYQLGQLGLFSSEQEIFIEREVQRLLHEPRLPSAGQMERDWIARMQRLARDRDFEYAGRAAYAARKWEELLPINPRHAGRYYTRSRLTPRGNKDEFKEFMALKEKAQRNQDWDALWFAKMMLDGLPAAAGTGKHVSNFKLECLYLLKQADGNMARLVRLQNVEGEVSGIKVLDSEAFHAPEKYRKWCLNQGNFVWGGGRTELDLLHEDFSNDAAYRVISEVVTFGWLPLAEKEGRLDGIWFFGDCAYANDERLKADEDGIYWYSPDGDRPVEGYQMSDEGRENIFCQKRPNLQPGRPVERSPIELTHLSVECASGGVGRLFREFCARLRRCLGGPEAFLLAGSVASYAAAPEIFRQYSMFPGLWVHGQAGSGKSTVVEWLMEWWGMKLNNGLVLRGNAVSAVGLMQAADQYSNLPVWAEEFRSAEVSEDKIGVLHNCYNRGGQFKFNPSRVSRVMRTAFMVTGESTMSDAAMRGRFPHVQVSASRRLGTPAEQKDDFRWFQENRQYFFHLGRWLMEHRKEFSRRVVTALADWEVRNVSKRDMLTNGVAYGSFLAMMGMLESHTGEELGEFRTWMHAHAQEAAADVRSDLFINVFWEHLITAYKHGGVPKQCFKVLCVNIGAAPGTSQNFWREYRLFIDPDATITALEIYLAKARLTLPLKRNDLRDQLSKNEYWIPGKHRQRFSSGGIGGIPCWGVDVNKHPMGYQAVSDEALREALDDSLVQSAQLPPVFKDGDPRKGPLFLIIEDLERKEGGANSL